MSEYLKASTVSTGTAVRCLGFTCIPDGAIRVVKDTGGGLFIDCDEGTHYLDGQFDRDAAGNEVYVGLLQPYAPADNIHTGDEVVPHDLSGGFVNGDHVTVQEDDIHGQHIVSPSGDGHMLSALIGDNAGERVYIGLSPVMN